MMRERQVQEQQAAAGREPQGQGRVRARSERIEGPQPLGHGEVECP